MNFYLKRTSIGPIRIRIFRTPVRYFYYELYLLDNSDGVESNQDQLENIETHTDQQNSLTLVNSQSPKNPNTIQFVYKNEILVKRQLDQQEIKKIVQMVSKVKPTIILTIEEDSFLIPDIGREIQVETNRFTYSYIWSSSEEHSSPNQLKQVIELSELISSLIEVDYSKLDMPMYL